MDAGRNPEWAVPVGSDKLKDPEVPDADGDEPQFEVNPEDEKEDEDQKKGEALEDQKAKQVNEEKMKRR